MHQPLSLGQLSKSLRQVTAAPFQTGQYAVTDQHADITATTRFGDPGQQTLPGLLRLQAQAQQITFIEGQSPARCILPLSRQTGQALLAMTHFIERAQNLTAGLQHPCAIVMGQRLEQRVTNALRQLQCFAVQPTGTPQITVHNRQVGQARQAHQALPITVQRQTTQRFAAICLRLDTVTAPPGNHPAQGQPLCQQAFLLIALTGRQKAPQLSQQFFSSIQLTGQRQGPAVEQNQAWRAGQQAIRQVHLPAQQGGDVLLGQ